MIFYYYNFVVYKKDVGVLGKYNEILHSTTYTVRSDHEYDDKSFSFVASRLVLAERVMLFNVTKITHVVVYEFHAGKLWDADTVTHTLLPKTSLYDGYNFELAGARAGRTVDGFHGLQWRRNSRVGAAYQGYFSACIGPDDAFNPTRGPLDRGAILLNMAGPLVTRCWPFFANQLAAMPQIQEEYSIDRFGKPKYFDRHTSGRRIEHVSDMARLRLRHLKYFPHNYYVDNIMLRAQKKMFAALREYFLRMNQFDHAWGDGHLPPSGAAYQEFHSLSSLWYPLMKIFGYKVDDALHGYLAAQWNEGNWYGGPIPSGVRWKSHGRQIDSCLRMLFHCHQWLRYYWGFGKPTSYPFYLYRWWRSHEWNNSQELYQAVFDDWDNITAIYFKVCDCINVLSQILLITEPVPTRGAAGAFVYPKPSRQKKANTSYPSAVPFEAMLEVLPFAREPWLQTPPPAPPPEALPASEAIAWDNGATEVPWDDGNESEWYAMQEAVRVALAKLEFVRRWVGKIRRQMPWYRSVPIEKIPPAQDESLNPFVDEPKPLDPELPWG
jgi:hypothetical protein